MPYTPPNSGLKLNARGGSQMPPAPGRMASPIDPPNAKRFSVKNAKMEQPPSAIEPGKGSIPVNPFTDSGKAVHGSAASDTVPRRPK